ncbi:MAG: CDP-alcohol phosphatidyltransferase family protein [bacterium]|nr:CDP-alcohol phosphatidyltransferase family protein [bacterium]
MKKFKKLLPNGATFFRIIISLIAPILFLTGFTIPAFITYVLAGLSDFLDGYLARKLDAHSEFGRKLDATSDKIFALSIVIPSLIIGNLLMVIPLILETIIASISLIAKRKNINIITKRVGKIKTCFLFTTLILGLITPLIPAFVYLLIPSLVITSKLQCETIKTYYNDYKHNKISNDIPPIEIIKQEVKNDQKQLSSIKQTQKIKNIANEVAHYCLPKVKTKKKSM